MNSIYLDANSTTRIDPQVQDAIVNAWRSNYANPASQHQPGQRARAALEQCRADIRHRLGASQAQQLIFTSGGTEANNLALRGIAWAARSQHSGGDRNEIVISAIEHPSVVGAAEFLRSQGFVVHNIAVSADGVTDIDHLASLLNSRTCLVSLMLVNNETGVIQPVQQAAQICRQRGIPLHCDGVQAISKLPVNMQQLGVSALTLTAHKMHGPRGIGGLLVDQETELAPILFGGFQQLGLRPGTEDVALAVGFAKAVELAVDGLAEHAACMCQLRDRLEQAVLAELPGCVIVGCDAARAPHTSNLCFAGVNRQSLLMACDQAGVSISTGSACASGSSEPSPVLLAMGCDSRLVEGSIRVSLSRFTTAAEIAAASDRIINCVNHLRLPKSNGK